MIADPLADYDWSPVEPDVLERFRCAFARHVSRFRPRALWQQPDGLYLADLVQTAGYGGLTRIDSSQTLNCVFSDLMYWESRFQAREGLPGHACPAYVVGMLMDRTGTWHFYVTLAHIGEPPSPGVKTVTTVVKETE